MCTEIYTCLSRNCKTMNKYCDSAVDGITKVMWALPMVSHELAVLNPAVLRVNLSMLSLNGCWESSAEWFLLSEGDWCHRGEQQVNVG